MAAALKPSAPTDIDGTRESLLDIVLGRVQKSGKTVILSRLIFVAKMGRRESSAENMKAFLNGVIEKQQADGEVTGFALVYPYCIAAMMEARTSSITAILRDIVEADPNESRMHETKVVSSTEDIPSRCHKGWHVAYIQSNMGSDGAHAIDCQTAVKLASDLNTCMRKLGHSLTGVSDAELRKQLQSLHNYHEELPNPDLMLNLLSAEDAPTIPEFLDIFDSPLNIDLDSEIVWPVPPRLKY